MPVLEIETGNEVIEIIVPAPAVIEVLPPPPAQIVEVAVPGPVGPVGPAGEGIAFEHVQSSALATWTIAIPDSFTRKPTVVVYSSDGELVEADVTVSAENVSIQFAEPYTGSAILS